MYRQFASHVTPSLQGLNHFKFKFKNNINTTTGQGMQIDPHCILLKRDDEVVTSLCLVTTIPGNLSPNSSV